MRSTISEGATLRVWAILNTFLIVGLLIPRSIRLM